MAYYLRVRKKDQLVLDVSADPIKARGGEEIREVPGDMPSDWFKTRFYENGTVKERVFQRGLTQEEKDAKMKRAEDREKERNDAIAALKADPAMANVVKALGL